MKLRQDLLAAESSNPWPGEVVLKLKKTMMLLAAVGAVGAGAGSVHAAEVVVTVTVICAPTGPAVIGCVAAGGLVHELVQLANGKEAFGPNGEGMKLLRGLGGLFGGGTDRKDPVVPTRTHRLRD